MKIIRKIIKNFKRLNKIKEFVQKLPGILAKNFFPTLIVFFVLALLFSGFFHFKYYLSAKKIEPEILEPPFIFNNKDIQEILKTWQEKEEKFKDAEFKKYPNLFEIDEKENSI